MIPPSRYSRHHLGICLLRYALTQHVQLLWNRLGNYLEISGSGTFRINCLAHGNNFRPTREAVFLFPIFELLSANTLFPAMLVEDAFPVKDTTGHISPLLHTILTLSSYILTHATSTSSPRSLSYANLSLHILLALVENDGAMSAMSKPSAIVIPICRQVKWPSFSNLYNKLTLMERDYHIYQLSNLGGQRSVHYWIAVYFGCAITCTNALRYIAICEIIV